MTNFSLPKQSRPSVPRPSWLSEQDAEHWEEVADAWFEIEADRASHSLTGARVEEVILQRELTGISMQYTAIEGVRQLGKRQWSVLDASDLAHTLTDQAVRMVGIITAYDAKRTKRGSEMAFLTLADITGTVKVTVFPKTLALLADRIVRDSLVMICGKVSHRPERKRERPKEEGDDDGESHHVEETTRVQLEIILDDVQPICVVAGSGNSGAVLS